MIVMQLHMMYILIQRKSLQKLATGKVLQQKVLHDKLPYIDLKHLSNEPLRENTHCIGNIVVLVARSSSL